MAHLKEALHEEREAKRDYLALAKKHPKEGRTLRSIAKDEGEHAGRLKKLEKKEHKIKRIAKRMK